MEAQDFGAAGLKNPYSSQASFIKELWPHPEGWAEEFVQQLSAPERGPSIRGFVIDARGSDLLHPAHQLPVETSYPMASKPAFRAIFSFPRDLTGKLFMSWALLHHGIANTPPTLGTLRCASETIFGAPGFS